MSALNSVPIFDLTLMIVRLLFNICFKYMITSRIEFFLYVIRPSTSRQMSVKSPKIEVCKFIDSQAFQSITEFLILFFILSGRLNDNETKF